MRKRVCAIVGQLAVLGSLVALSSGCALSELKNTNRRLKEANDDLVSKYNRLEQELATLSRDNGDKDKEIARLHDLLAAGAPPRDEPPPQRPAAAAAVAEVGDFNSAGLESGTSSEGTWVRLDTAVLFPLGRAQLSPQGTRVLDRVVSILRTKYGGRTIRVEGHTDSTPIRKVKTQYPTNWELSTARACAVVRHLESRGIQPQRIYPAGFSFHKPRASGNSERSRQENRRVEILILKPGMI
jgi:flagellar motor protein MotB